VPAEEKKRRREHAEGEQNVAIQETLVERSHGSSSLRSTPSRPATHSSPSVTRTVIERMAHQPTPDLRSTGQLDALTPREREVLELIARGLSNGEIASELVIEESTVKTHVKRILMKLRLRDRIQAVIYAYENGLTRPGPKPAA
jgi:DNA-binding NarL/FixJ family response regulator